MPTSIVIRDPSVIRDPNPTPRRRVSTLSPHAHTQNDDISTSPRFLGYVFSFLSSAVSLASSIMFYVRGVYPVDFDDFGEWAEKKGINITENDLDELTDIYNQMDFSSKLFLTSGGVVTQNYQVYGSITISALLTGITMLVVFAHLDSYCFPNYFRQFFRDGSVSERNLIIVLIVISAISLQICTSRFSIGEAQVNVFFSTWTTFGSSVLNFAVWRNSAGRHSVFQNVLYDREFPLKRHWFVLSIFATITFLALIDYLASTYIFQGELEYSCLKFSWSNKWFWMCLAQLIMTWVAFFMRKVVVFKKKWMQKSTEFSISLVIVILSGYVIVNLTGGRLAQITCPSNLYFSIWGTFFTGLWIMSILLETSQK